MWLWIHFWRDRITVPFRNSWLAWWSQNLWGLTGWGVTICHPFDWVGELVFPTVQYDIPEAYIGMIGFKTDDVSSSKNGMVLKMHNVPWQGRPPCDTFWFVGEARRNGMPFQVCFLMNYSINMYQLITHATYPDAGWMVPFSKDAGRSHSRSMGYSWTWSIINDRNSNDLNVQNVGSAAYWWCWQRLATVYQTCRPWYRAGGTTN